MEAEFKQARIKGAHEKFCTECGETINAKAEICPKCGVRQMAVPISDQGSTAIKKAPPDKFIAAMLALFLGGLGIHKFYLGQNFWGVVYLLLCWTFIPVLLGFFGALSLLFMSQKTFLHRFGDR